MKDLVMAEILEDIRTIEVTWNAYTDFISPHILEHIPKAEQDLRQKMAAVNDIMYVFFQRIHARVEGKDLGD